MNPDLEAALDSEQTYVNIVYRRLDELRANTRARLIQTRKEGPSGSPQNRSERDAFAAHYEDRLAQLSAVEERLVFGRLDMEDGQKRYLGKIGILDQELQPLLIDWRADVVRPFYTATAAKPEGLLRRRHLLTRMRHVISLEDEVVNAEGFAASELAEVPLQGDGALMAAISAERTGRMSDIVATIQAEQDEIVRAPIDGVLVVQGGPGTGKTAVALHRAAYVLYNHRERLARSGVLIIGPSSTFLRYIEKVLPALGETGVVYTTMGGLLPGLVTTENDVDEVAELKGRSEWAQILQGAVAARQRVLPRQRLRVGPVEVVLEPKDVRNAIAKARRNHTTHNAGRVTFVKSMLKVLASQLSEVLGAQGIDDRETLLDDLRMSDDVRKALNLCWLPWSAQGLLADLFAKPHRLAEVAPKFTEAERALLHREKTSEWTVSDIPLLDELEELLGPIEDAMGPKRTQEDSLALENAEAAVENTATSAMVSAKVLAARFSEEPARLAAADAALHDRSWTYGHIVVDEAQELTAMAWRMLTRRNPSRSMTLVGDVAQVSSAGGTQTWEQTLPKLFGKNWRLATLSVNYRTPESIMDLAQEVARTHNPHHPPTAIQSARDVPNAINFYRTTEISSQIKELAEQLRGAGGIVAVIATAAMAAKLRGDLGIETTDSLRSPIVILDLLQIKGLEFDHVIVVEPADILASSHGANALYVALTRPTTSLSIVHARELPAGLAESPAPEPTL